LISEVKAIDLENASIFASNSHILVIALDLSFPLGFYIYCSAYTRIHKLMMNIENRMSKKTVEQVEKEERLWMIPVYISMTFTLLTSLAYFFFEDIELSFTGIILVAMGFYATFGTQALSLIANFIYLDFSVQITALLKEIENEVNHLMQVYDDERIKKSVAKINKLHNDNQYYTEELIQCYGSVLKMSFTLSTWLMAQAAIFVIEKKWIELFVFEPFLLFEIWLLCYSSEKIISEVNRMIN
jgi:hypothetical protein